MTKLMRTSEIAKLPVVTLAGEDIAQIKDVVYSADGGAVVGFTLAGRGLLAGPLKQSLMWGRVEGLGPDAVVVADEESLEPLDTVLAAATSEGLSRKGGNVLGNQVLTDSGKDLGKIIDAVVSFTRGADGECDVVGYEISASEALAAAASKGSKGTKLLIPLPDTLAVSGEHLMVPAAAESFVTDDLAGFGAAVDNFRTQLRGDS